MAVRPHNWLLVMKLDQVQLCLPGKQKVLQTRNRCKCNTYWILNTKQDACESEITTNYKAQVTHPSFLPHSKESDKFWCPVYAY